MSMRIIFRVSFLLLSLTAVQLLPAVQAGSLEPPAGKVILTVSGNIANTNAGDQATFDRAMLEAFGLSELALKTTPWTDGEQVFNGVLASKVLDAVGASGSVIVARALNDYQIKIPLSDFTEYPVLFALKQNGRYMRVRDKGPIWIVYPKTSFPELDTEEINDRWIWQLSHISIE